MTIETAFSERILQEAARLTETGLDANQIAGLLCKRDPDGCNYGIGIILDKDGKPAATSATLLEAAREELAQSGKGAYQNSDALMKEMTEAVLRWQGVPEGYWQRFRLLLPSDAGTGAVQTAIQIASLWDEAADTLAVGSSGGPPGCCASREDPPFLAASGGPPRVKFLDAGRSPVAEVASSGGLQTWGNQPACADGKHR